MEGNENNLFSADNVDVILPGATQNGQEGSAEKIDKMQELMSEDIGKVIQGNVVKSILIPEESSIEQPNYVIDFSEVEEIDEIQIKALDALLNESGDVAVYAYIKGGIQKLGDAYDFILNRILLSSLANLFNNRCKVYKNFVPGEPVKQLKYKDISNMRLSI